MEDKIILTSKLIKVLNKKEEEKEEEEKEEEGMEEEGEENEKEPFPLDINSIRTGMFMLKYYNLSTQTDTWHKAGAQ